MKCFKSGCCQKMSITEKLLLNWYFSMKKKIRKIRTIFDVENWLWKSEFCNFQQLLRKFTQDLKKNLLGSSLAFTLKEGPVRCAKVCNKSWVILKYLYPCSESDDNEEKPEVTITPSVSTNSILKPEDYSKFGMPSGYIFWPTANVFVHPTVLKVSLFQNVLLVSSFGQKYQQNFFQDFCPSL